MLKETNEAMNILRDKTTMFFVGIIDPVAAGITIGLFIFLLIGLGAMVFLLLFGATQFEDWQHCKKFTNADECMEYKTNNSFFYQLISIPLYLIETIFNLDYNRDIVVTFWTIYITVCCMISITLTKLPEP